MCQRVCHDYVCMYVGISRIISFFFHWPISDTYLNKHTQGSVQTLDST